MGLIVLLTVIGCVFSPDFRSIQNFQNVFEQSAPLAFTALGQTVVIITRGIDLSIDAQIALLSSLASGIVDSDPQKALPVVLGILALGAIIGLITGGLIVALRIHALIVTLGMAAILQGLALLYTLTPVGGIPDGYDFFGYGRVLGVPVGMALAVALFAIVGFVLTYTRLGRQIYAFGGDPHAATMVGLPTTRVILFTYCLMGFLTAVTVGLSRQPPRRGQSRGGRRIQPRVDHGCRHRRHHADGRTRQRAWNAAWRPHGAAA